jgi:hypothetical protein
MKAPKAPDPIATAKAQTEQNVQTATTQQQLNMVDQTTPDGNVRYTQTGTWADGTPKFEATTSLDALGQQANQQSKQFDVLTNQIGIDQAGRIAQTLGQPVNLNNETTEARLMELGRRRLDPVMRERRDSLETDLINRGIRPGSAAYDSMKRQNNEAENDAFNQLLLSGRGQAVQEALTERNQPINEITALMSGGQVSQPQFAAAPQTGVANTDLAGMIYRNYEGKLANHNATMGGLFGLGGALIGAAGRVAGGGR